MVEKKQLNSGPVEKLGAHWDGKGVNFAIYSSTAEKIELCLFDKKGKEELERIILTNRTDDDVWHVYVPDLKPEQVYGYRVYGENNPSQGYIFNPENILLDPYAREVLSNQNNVPILGRVIDDNYDWEGVESPNTSWSDTIIYEMHSKGYTETMLNIDANIRGTVEALGQKESIDHLKDLGVTAVELLPMQAFHNEGHLQEISKSNYWGYNTASFFAPHPDYLKTGSIKEFKDAVKALHKEGIEVILDVVYNHTAEGGKGGPIISFKGIDNKTYYRLVDDDKSHYINETGCGNTLNTSHPQVRKMVIDSLRYWVEECKVDGFRFDLAVSLGRSPHDFDSNSEFFQEIKKDPVLSKIKMIAEPWDLGWGGYQLGNFPAGWGEWNDKFRDGVRSFWRGDFGKIGEKARLISGSSQEFAKDGRSALSSINFISAHDGFTLNDVVSYNYKHNEANGENNRDGNNNNLSNNYGVEGETDNQYINDLRQRQKKNMLTSLFLSHGTPMLLAGDEFGNSQGGNNNAYCQDNEIGWLNWDKITNEGKELKSFVKKLIEIRKDTPALTQDDFLHGEKTGQRGIKDISWCRPNGNEIKGKYWHIGHAQCLGVLFNNAAIKDKETKKTTKTNRLLVIYNASSENVNFSLPTLSGDKKWTRVLDSSKNHDTMNLLTKKAGEKYSVADHSVAIFTQKRRRLALLDNK